MILFKFSGIAYFHRIFNNKQFISSQSQLEASLYLDHVYLPQSTDVYIYPRGRKNLGRSRQSISTELRGGKRSFARVYTHATTEGEVQCGWPRFGRHEYKAGRSPLHRRLGKQRSHGRATETARTGPKRNKETGHLATGTSLPPEALREASSSPKPSLLLMYILANLLLRSSWIRELLDGAKPSIWSSSTQRSSANPIYVYVRLRATPFHHYHRRRFLCTCIYASTTSVQAAARKTRLTEDIPTHVKVVLYTQSALIKED